MNNSQISLSASESGQDGHGASFQHSAPSSAQVGVVSPIGPHSASASNLSGLVCNVHRTTGQEPHALVGATTTIVGDKLYVFGGRVTSRTRSQLTANLYELDLIRRHWTKLDVVGDIPPPRYFHSMCALGDTKLVCYGGMSPAPQGGMRPGNEPQPEVVVMSDVHVYDVPSRTWTLVHGLGHEGPQGRYAHCATVLPSSAVFSSAEAPMAAIHHNPPSSDPHSGTLGVQLDGTGGAEMIVVGGQDSSNNYIEQISVFNLRSLRWTTTTLYESKCGAYKSMVAAMPGVDAEKIGRGVDLEASNGRASGTPTLIYSNYNFLDVRLEMQIRLPDGTMIERTMAGPLTPPGLRFPNGGIINGHFVVSGTYLTSSKHEYALWALDLKTLTWGRIDTAGTVFGQGSWNRGILWNRRSTFVILGHRKRSLVDDYNHRRVNFSHICMVELEAFGLYDNPRKLNPTSAYISVSAPSIPASLQPNLSSSDAGGRGISAVAEQLGQTALALRELSDMEIVALGGEKIPCNSYMLARRWGPYFHQLMADAASATAHDTSALSDAATLRPSMHSQASRNSAVTITPSINGTMTNSSAASLSAGPGSASAGSSLLDTTSANLSRSVSRSTVRTLVEMPHSNNVQASSRPRLLYLPHMAATVRLMLHFLYTSSLPPLNNPMCSPLALCSLLQMARPYQIDGLQEATVERLHEVLDGRNAAAVFNAAAMAAGGGRATGSGIAGIGRGTLAELERREGQATAVGTSVDDSTHRGGAGVSVSAGTGSARPGRQGLRLNTQLDHGGRSSSAATGSTSRGLGHGHEKADSVDSSSTATSATASTSTDIDNMSMSQTDNESSHEESSGQRPQERGVSRQVWTGDVSAVIGLQKRGLRGLMEGRRLRERANTADD